MNKESFADPASETLSTVLQDGLIHSWDANNPRVGRPLLNCQTEPGPGPVQAMTAEPNGLRVFGLHVTGALSCWTAAPALSDAAASTKVTWVHNKVNQHSQASLSQLAGASQLAWLGGTGESLAGEVGSASSRKNSREPQIAALCPKRALTQELHVRYRQTLNTSDVVKQAGMKVSAVLMLKIAEQPCQIAADEVGILHGSTCSGRTFAACSF